MDTRIGSASKLVPPKFKKHKAQRPRKNPVQFIASTDSQSNLAMDSQPNPSLILVKFKLSQVVMKVGPTLHLKVPLFLYILKVRIQQLFLQVAMQGKIFVSILPLRRRRLLSMLVFMVINLQLNISGFTTEMQVVKGGDS